MNETLTNWTMALLLAFGMAVTQWDGIEDHSGEMAQAKSELHAQRTADALEASQEADRKLCRDQYGENATAMQLPNGDSVCTDKRGRRIRNQIVVAVKK